VTRRQLARERRAYNRARRGEELRRALREFRWPEACDGCRWWATWQGTPAQRRAADCEVGDAFS
jgi:hypothetical protein